MPSLRPDANLSALRNNGARPGQVLDVVVLTTDAGVLATLRETAGPEHVVWHAASADAAVDYLVGGRCCILIVDLGALRGDAASLLERLLAQFPELILMATGRREQEAAVARLISSGRIYRFLHKPISPSRASLFLSAATRRYDELADVAPMSLATVRTMAEERSNTGAFLAAGGGVMAAIVVFLLWYSMEQQLPAPAPTPQPTAVSSPAAALQAQVDAKLDSAQIAFLTGRLSEPPGDNALEYYRAVLALQPDSLAGQAGVKRVVDALEARVVKALEARDPPKVVTAWSALQRAAPDHPRLDAFRDQLMALSRSTARVGEPDKEAIERARSAAPVRRVLPPGAVRPAEDPPSGDVGSASEPDASDDVQPRRDEPKVSTPPRAKVSTPPRAKVNTPPRETAREPNRVAAPKPAPSRATIAQEIAAITRLRDRGALITPAGNNAYERMLALRNRAPNVEEVRNELQRLAFALVDRARTALAANNVDEAAAYVKGADTLWPGMTAIRAVKEQLTVAQTKQDALKNPVQATTLKRTREVAAAYPRDARRRGKEGSVQVEFTIDLDGTPKDLVVREADPPGVFDKAALESVRKWRFEPVRKNGLLVEQRAVLQIQFTLRD